MKPLKSDTHVPQKLAYIIAAIMVLLPFHAFLTTWGGSNTGFIDIWRIWKEVLIVFILFPSTLWLVWRSAGLRNWLINSWTVRLIGLYAVVQLLLGGWALLTGRVNHEALLYALGVNLRFLLFFLIGAAIASYSDFIKRHWRKIILWPATAVLAFGLLQKFVLPYDFLRHFGYGPNTIPAYQSIDNNLDHRRIQSFLRGANPLGAYLGLVIPVLLIGLKRKTAFWWPVAAASLLVLFFSYSRSAWLGIFVSSILVVWIMVERTRKLQWLFMLTGVIFVFIAGLAYGLRDNDTAQNILFHSSENSKSSQSSNAARLQSLENGAKDIIHEPLGRGPGTAGPASFRNEAPARISENYYLQIGQEAGVAGMGIFIAINILVACELWRRRSDQLATVLLISFAGLSFINLISHAWADDTLSLLWWGLAGVAIAPAILKESRSSKQHG